MKRVIVIALLFVVSLCEAANLLENSSFEAGDLRGWSFGAYSDSKRSAIPLMFTNRYTYHGGLAAMMETGAETFQTFVSRLYRLPPSTQYTLSGYVKAETDNFNYAHPFIRVMNSRSGGDAYTYSTILTTTNWTRFSITFTTTNVEAQSVYFIKLQHLSQSSPQGRYLYFDALQLEEGASATDYTPASKVEIGCNLNRSIPAHIFYTDETPVVHLVGYNDTGAETTVTPLWRVRDYWGAFRQSNSTSITIPANSRKTNAVTITPSGTRRYGIYELSGWLPGTNSSQFNATIAILPRPVTLAHRTNSIFGSETYNSSWFLSAFQRMGIHWNRNLSVDTWSEVSDFAPTSLSSLVLHTNRVSLMRTYEIEPLVQLGEGQTLHNMPTYMQDSALANYPSNVLWSEYCWKVVSNYMAWCTYYEIGNEQVYSGATFDNVNVYHTNITKLGAAAVRLADPTAIIVAPAEGYSHAVSNMLAAHLGESNSVDIFSTHIYPGNEYTDKIGYPYVGRMMNHFGKGGWNTESGGRNDTFDTLALLEESQLVPSISPVNGYSRHRNFRVTSQLHNLWGTLLGPVRKYFYYEGRNTGGHDGYIAFSLFDWPNTVSPMGAAFACQAYIMDNGSSLGTNFFHTNVLSYAWTRSNQVTFALFPTLAVQLSGNPAQRMAVSTSDGTAEILDIFGNAYPAGPVLFGREPVFVRGASGTTSNNLATSITVYNTNDIEAPKLTITQFPTGTNFTRQTWGYRAPDDTCLETRDVVTADAVRFQTMVSGDSGWSILTNVCFVTRTNIVLGDNPVFYVRAQDKAGNVAIAQWPEDGPPPPPEPPSNGAVISGGAVIIRGEKVIIQ